MAAYINLQLNLVFSCNLFFSMGLAVGYKLCLWWNHQFFYHVGGDFDGKRMKLTQIVL